MNYMFKTWFKTERFLMVLNQFWDRVLRIRIELRDQNEVQSDGQPTRARDPVWAPVLEHSYSITCSKVGSEMNAFWWSGNGFGIGFLRIRIELRDQNEVQSDGQPKRRV